MMRLFFSGFWGAALLLMVLPAHAALGLNRVIPLPGVHGQFGRMALDSKHQRLFVNVTGSDMLLVVDLTTDAVRGRITGLDQPLGVTYLAQSDRLVVGNRGNGDLDFYDADALTSRNAITFGGDADGLCYDTATGRLYFGYGDGHHKSGIAIMDSDGKPLAQLPLDSHPAGFAVDASAKRLYVNLPASREIAVFDLTSDKRIATWRLGIESGANFPMVLDAAHDRLFVATRAPDRLLVIEMRSGRVLQTLAAPGDVDDLFYNAAIGELYATGGVGKLAVYAGAETGRLSVSEDIRTLRGARASLLDAAAGRYYLAVPAGQDGMAEIRVYVVTAPGKGNTP
ncbi:MAG: hypothetical protein WBR15_08360 [Gammaproteobacteria bacterium]